MGLRAFYLLLVCLLCGSASLALGADQGSINSGETRSSTIGPPSFMDTWTFEGNAGERVIINAVTTSGNLDTTIYLYPPGGGPAEASTYHSYLGSIWGDDQLSHQLQHTGLYTIVIQDATINRSGTYSISFLKIPGAVYSTADPDGGPIASGQIRSGTINVASDLDAGQFYGQAGQRVIINAVTTSGNLDTTIYLYPPGGGPAEASTFHSYLGSIWGGDQLDYQLENTGLYTIVIQDAILSRTGTFNISFLTIPGPVSSKEDPDGGPIASGQTKSGTINVASDLDAGQFYGQAGERVIISAVTTSGNLDTTIYLYPPGNGPAEASTYHSYLGSIWGDDQLSHQLQNTGLYTIVIQDSILSRTGTYNISFTKIPATPNPGIYNPSPANGATIYNINGAFTWNAVASATGYDLYFASDLTQAPQKIGVNLVSPSMAFPALTRGQDYYWAVIAHTAQGDIMGPVSLFLVSMKPPGVPWLPLLLLQE